MSKPLKVTIVFSDMTKAPAYEWFVDEVDRTNIAFTFVFLNAQTSDTAEYIRAKGLPVHYISYRGKKDLPLATLRLIGLFLRTRPDIVHTHLFGASLAGLTAAWITRIKNRIHTRHHSSFHHDYHPHAVKYDRYINRLSTHIVATDKLVHDILVNQEAVPEKKISIIYLGFKLDYFRHVEASRIQFIRERYGIPDNGIVYGMVSRLMTLKGVDYALRALERLLNEEPTSVAVIANAKGSQRQEVENMIARMDCGARIILIEFETEMNALYKAMHYFIHVPINHRIEAFGQVYIEAMAAGIPCVVTISGIANEVIKHEHNALVVDYCNSDEIYFSLKKLQQDTQLKDKIVQNAVVDSSHFEFSPTVAQLENLYLAGITS
ncbi:MAG: glycosyltransferase family 4 protein [Gammaproteobacteria bacterium]|nr:glycosyltransferase family 4 protein [Gammaproteobacteria bacterium]